MEVGGLAGLTDCGLPMAVHKPMFEIFGVETQGRLAQVRRWSWYCASGTWVLVLERTEPVLSTPGESQRFELTAVM